MSEYELFGAAASPFVEKVKRGLTLKKIAFESVPIRSPLDFARWNPVTGKMPVLKVDGEKLYDSTFILRYIDRKHPEPPLLSDDPEIAARQRQLEDWSDESLYWYGMALRWSEKNRAACREQIIANLPVIMRPVAGVILPRRLTAYSTGQGLGRLPYNILLREMEGRLDDLSLMLGKRAFFFADRVSIADLSIYGMFHALRSGPTPDGAALIADQPALVDWAKRVTEATRAA
jgi:glutathione S-transferase